MKTEDYKLLMPFQIALLEVLERIAKALEAQ